VIGNKGLFCFMLVLAMTLILLELSVFSSSDLFVLNKTKTQLIDFERASMQRVLLENNTDKIVFSLLEKNALLRNLNAKAVQTEINSALLFYLAEKSFASTIFFDRFNPLSLDFLMMNSSVAVFQSQGLVYAEYAFVSDVSKTKTVASQLGTDAKIFFMLPAGYSINLIR